MTVAELGQRMSQEELNRWSIFWGLENEDEEKRIKELEEKSGK